MAAPDAAPAADHAALWPDTVSGDASLKYFRVGVRARNGATASAVFDRLRFQRKRSSPADGAALLRSVVSEYRDRYPGIAQYAASEISLVKHMNAFGGDGTLPTYHDSSLIKDSSVRAQQEMVRFLHRHGAACASTIPRRGHRDRQAGSQPGLDEGPGRRRDRDRDRPRVGPSPSSTTSPPATPCS